MSDTPTGETVNVPTPKNDATPPVPAPQPKTEDSAVEELKKQLHQQEMRANQLANQLKAKDDAEAAAKATELEEQNQYKELFEQEKAKREAIEAERETAERQKALEDARNSVLGNYSDDVKTLAKDTGIDLNSADEASVAQFKEKLDKLSNVVTTNTTVTPNNPGKSAPKSDYSSEELQVVLENDGDFDALLREKFPGIASLMTPRK